MTTSAQRLARLHLASQLKEAAIGDNDDDFDKLEAEGAKKYIAWIDKLVAAAGPAKAELKANNRPGPKCSQFRSQILEMKKTEWYDLFYG